MTTAAPSLRVEALRRALFEPNVVALVGQSANPNSTASRPLTYLRRWGFRGTVYPVNAARSTVFGEPAWPSVSDLPERPDHAFVMAPTEHVLEIVTECVAAGVAVVTVLASGFTEGGAEGMALTQRLLSLTAGTQTRILGPSSLGLVNLRNGLTLTANAAFAESSPLVGSTLMVSQSGSMIGALVTRGKSLGVGFAALVSVGNEIDLSVGEICASTVDDPSISSYALFMENINGAERLQQFAADAEARGKPVVAYKLGRSTAGAELALSHTGALAGEDEVAAAFVADSAIARVKTLDGLLESVSLAGRIGIGDAPHRNPRVGVVTTTGGGAAMVVDSLGVLGIDVTPPSPATFAQLAKVGAPARLGRIVDLTLAGTKHEVMSAALKALIDAREHDLIVVVVGSSARYEPEVAVRPIVTYADRGTPLAAFLVPDAPEGLAMLAAAGVPAFRTPESCADAIAAVFSRRHRRLPAVIGRTALAAKPRRVLDERSAYDLVGEVGVPHAQTTVVDARSDDLPELPFDYPVVAKVLCSDITHKTDVGGVILNVGDRRALEHAVKQIRANIAEHFPDHDPVPILVEPMITDAVAEVLVGYRIDPHAGPIVLLAQGGELAEIYQDRSIRLAPVDLDTAREMITAVRSMRVLQGFRSRPAADITALAETIVAMSRLAQLPTVIEAEVNPLIVRRAGSGVIAVDALVAVTADQPVG